MLGPPRKSVQRTIGQTLRNAREVAGLSQYSVGKLGHVDQRELSKLERDQRPELARQIAMLSHLAACYGVRWVIGKDGLRDETAE